MDYKLKNMTYYRNYGSASFGINPYAIYDMKDKILYLPDFDWLQDITNSDYQKWIDQVLGNNIEGRYNVLLMGNIKWKKVLSMKLGTYTLNPLKLSTKKFDTTPYIGYFISEE